VTRKKKQNENDTGWARELIDRTENGNYKNPDNDPNGPWIATSVTANHYYDADYKITKPNGIVLSKPKNDILEIQSKKHYNNSLKKVGFYGVKEDLTPKLNDI